MWQTCCCCWWSQNLCIFKRTGFFFFILLLRKQWRRRRKPTAELRNKVIKEEERRHRLPQCLKWQTVYCHSLIADRRAFFWGGRAAQVFLPRKCSHKLCNLLHFEYWVLQHLCISAASQGPENRLKGELLCWLIGRVCVFVHVCVCVCACVPRSSMSLLHRIQYR